MNETAVTLSRAMPQLTFAVWAFALNAPGVSMGVRVRRGRSLLPRYDHVVVARFRFMVIDEDGQRIGRFESGDPSWRAGDTFTLDEQLLRILEILPEVSTMVAYNAVWVVTPATDDDDDDDDEQATDHAVADAVGRTHR
jgi:hypothetical protein